MLNFVNYFRTNIFLIKLNYLLPLLSILLFNLRLIYSYTDITCKIVTSFLNNH